MVSHGSELGGHGHDFGHEFVSESVSEADSDTDMGIFLTSDTGSDLAVFAAKLCIHCTGFLDLQGKNFLMSS